MADESGQAGRAPQLGLWDAVSIILGIIIGATIYKTPPDIFRLMSEPAMAYTVWAVCGILALVGALCYAELATTYPRDGGDYVYLSRAYGPLVGYLFGWTQLAVIQTASIGLMAYVFADYAARLYAPSPHAMMAYACAAIVAFTVLNLAGVRFGRPVQNLLTLTKVLGLGAIVVVAIGFAHKDEHVVVGHFQGVEDGVLALTGDPGYGERDEAGNVNPTYRFHVKEGADGTKLQIGFRDTITDKGKSEPRPIRFDDFARSKHIVVDYTRADGELHAVMVRTVKSGLHLPDLMFAMVLVFLAYGGWNDAAFVAAEVRDPGRNIPAALIVGTLGVMGIYVLINWAYVTALGWEAAQDSDAIAADVLNLLPGGFGQTAMCVLVMISALGAINGLIFTSSRVYATLGADYSLFSWLARRHAGTGAPVFSLLLQMIICLGMVVGVASLKGDQSGFDTLLQCTAPIFWLFFLLTAVSVIILRIKDRDVPRPFRVPVFPILPLIFIATCGYMLYSGYNYAAFLGRWALAGPALVLAGLPFFFLSRRTPQPGPAPTPLVSSASRGP